MKQWQSVHPAGLRCSSDSFYADVARFIANAMKTAFGNENDDITDECFARTAIDLTAYLEDKINGLNLWNSFISLYKKEYGNDYPFYSIEDEEMYADEPNLPDVRFLLWRGLNRSNPLTLVNPLNPFIEQLAEPVFQTLMEAFENAPESNELSNAIYNAAQFDDPITVRNICGWLTASAYLTRIPNPDETLAPVVNQISSFAGNRIQPSQMSYFVDSFVCISTLIGPLAVSAPKWLSEILTLKGDAELQPIAEQLREIRSLSLMPYQVTATADDSFTVRNLRNEELTVSHDTLVPEVIPTIKEGLRFVSSLYFYKGIWHVNGLSTFSPEPIDFQEDISEYDKKEAELKEAYQFQLDKNSGSPIGVAKDWDEFSKRFDLDKATDNSPKHMQRHIKSAKNILYFINSSGSMSMLPNSAQLVALPDNELYNKEEATRRAATLLFDKQTTPEMRSYMMDNNILPDARLAGPCPDEEAKPWFRANERFLSTALNSDIVKFEEF